MEGERERDESSPGSRDSVVRWTRVECVWTRSNAWNRDWRGVRVVNARGIDTWGRERLHAALWRGESGEGGGVDVGVRGRAIVGVAPRLPWRLSARRPINSIPMATTDNIGHTPVARRLSATSASLARTHVSSVGKTPFDHPPFLSIPLSSIRFLRRSVDTSFWTNVSIFRAQFS